MYRRNYYGTCTAGHIYSTFDNRYSMLLSTDDWHIWSTVIFRFGVCSVVLLWCCTLLKNKRKSYIWKVKRDRVQTLIWLTASSYMTLHQVPSEFPHIWGKFSFLFYQCRQTIANLVQGYIVDAKFQKYVRTSCTRKFLYRGMETGMNVIYERRTWNFWNGTHN